MPGTSTYTRADADQRFAALQRRLTAPVAPTSGRGRLYLAIPSINLGAEYEAHQDLAALETRVLHLALALREPNTQLVLVTSQALGELAIRYTLQLTGAPCEARDRLTLISLDDLDRRPLAAKVLERPDILDRLRGLAATSSDPVILPFCVDTPERDLAIELGVPVFGPRPDLGICATKSGGRRLFAAAGVPVPYGVEHVTSPDEVAQAAAEIRGFRRDAASVLVKLDQGVLGYGNATLSLADLPAPGSPRELDVLRERAEALPATVLDELSGGAVVEETIVGTQVASPSVQLLLEPGGEVTIAGTHDQTLGGERGQTFVGSRFPADPEYGPQVAQAALRIGRRLAAAGAVGRAGVDFIVARGFATGGWTHYALEINLRETGTSHTLRTLQLLTGGRLDPDDGTFRTPDGRAWHYVATDGLTDPAYRAIEPWQLLAAAREAGLAFDRDRGDGAVFHMLPSLNRTGRLSVTAIAGDRVGASELFARVKALVNDLAEARPPRATASGA